MDRWVLFVCLFWLVEEADPLKRAKMDSYVNDGFVENVNEKSK